jgi:hypothetical protein
MPSGRMIPIADEEMLILATEHLSAYFLEIFEPESYDLGVSMLN